jgi:diadenosine tetraphosphate (Ap4A) HIT family hydrolase
VMNCNGDGGQTVFQIHLHLLAGAALGRFATPKCACLHKKTPGLPGVFQDRESLTTSPTRARAPVA